MQDPDPGLQLRLPGESHNTGIDLAADRRLQHAKRGSLLFPRLHSGLLVLRVAAEHVALPHRLRVEATWLDMAPLAAVANVDHSAHLDTEMRASRGHGETLRGADV